MKNLSFLLLVVSLLFQNQLLGQKLVHGTVTDASNNQPLAGAMVYSSTDSTITDQQGSFAITLASFPEKLQVSYMGYENTTIRVGEQDASIQASLIPSTLALNEVVITSGIQENKLRNITGSVDVIGRSMLQRDDPFTITNSINRIPSVYMHSGAYNTSRITIRGIGSRDLYGTSKIKAYFDQIPLTDGSGNSTIEDIDQALIERIEVVKGPNSSLYGAGLAGVVKLNSYRPPSNQTSLESQLTMGSYNTSRWMNRFSHDDENKSISLVYSKMHSDGYRENSEYDRDQIGLTSRFYLNDNSYVSFLGVFTSMKAYIPSSINAQDFSENPEVAAANWAAAKGYEAYDKSMFGMSYTSEFAPNWELSASVFLKSRDAYEPTPIFGQGILDEKTVSLGTRDIITYSLAKFSFSAGFEFFHDTYEWSYFENLYTDSTGGSVLGPVFAINEEDRSYSNIFAEASFQPTDRLAIVVGANLNHTNYQLSDKYVADSVDQGGDYSFDPVVSPRIGASYALNTRTNLYLNVSHGFSPPSLDETLRPEGMINTNIQPETGWNFEAGIRGNASRLNYDAAVYYMQIQNLIVPQRIGQNQYIGVNAGLNTHIGLDLYTNYFVNLTPQYTLNIFNSLSWMHYEFTDFINEGEDYSGNQLTGVPQLMLNPGVEVISESGFYGNVNGRYTGEIPIDDANSLYSDSYFILSSKVGYRLILDHWEVDVNGGVNNLTDEKYASMLLINANDFGGGPRYYYPGLPRNYFGGLSVKYIF